MKEIDSQLWRLKVQTQGAGWADSYELQREGFDPSTLHRGLPLWHFPCIFLFPNVPVSNTSHTGLEPVLTSHFTLITPTKTYIQ